MSNLLTLILKNGEISSPFLLIMPLHIFRTPKAATLDLQYLLEYKYKLCAAHIIRSVSNYIAVCKNQRVLTV